MGVAVSLTGLIMMGGLIVYAAGIPEGAKYVGSSKCRVCHMKDYKTWKGTKHAKNFKLLEGTERSDPACVKCHVTGFGKPGGFVSEKETPKMKNVGCESCHGPGSEHVAAAKKAPKKGAWEKKVNKVPHNTCVKCHNPHVNQKAHAEKLRKEHKTK
ncbi:MAG: cytochrome c family protein [Phycisphaerae bacterium]|nr:cytochrome c family protein [Phycisphaerae bacterium]